MRQFFLIPIMILIIFYSCKESSTGLNNEIDQFQIHYSAEDSIEGFELALWFEGNLLPSDLTIKNCLFSINYLRYTMGNYFAVLYHNRFQLPWRIGELVICFDDSTAALVNNHQYDGWNQIELYLRPDTIFRYPDKLGIAHLGFEEPYNPQYLSEVYSNLPGVRFCEPNIIHLVGTFPIFPGYINGEMSYVFVENYIHSGFKYYYFKYIDEKPFYIGFNVIIGQDDPDWWSEAYNNIQHFYALE